MPDESYVAPWKRDPENFKLVAVNRHYWIDPGTNFQLAHLVAGAMPPGPHEADAICEAPPNKPLLWPLVGVGVKAVQRIRACPRCLDLIPAKDVIT
jgi:hypothetical protein